jgi:hypothetical protein
VHQRVMHVDLSTIVQYKSAGSGIVVLWQEANGDRIGYPTTP